LSFVVDFLAGHSLFEKVQVIREEISKRCFETDNGTSFCATKKNYPCVMEVQEENGN